MFPDIPWVIAPDGESAELRKVLATYWPNQAERRSRLYAMGFDAYRLVPLINAGMGPNRLQAMTGVLHLDADGRILRHLPWARIQRGQPKLMDPTPRPSTAP
jgi:outer membrane PBP1 activator LpoA protein